MKVIVPGHEYELLNHAKNRVGATLNFINKKEGATVKDGTTTEEVLIVLIDRIEHLDSKFPCKENKAAIKALKKALEALNARTEDRQTRGVEGKDEK